MKIEQKIIFSNLFNLALIILIGLFTFQSMNLALTKLRFVEIADDLNASFLEMRLSEKNFFLYHDRKTLTGIRDQIEGTAKTIGLVRDDIIRAIGEADYEKLESSLQTYAAAVEEARVKPRGDARFEARLRSEGKRLKEFSDSITHLERQRVNGILLVSKKVLFLSFGVILVIAVVVSHLVSQKILRSLRAIEKLAKSISEGNFNKIEGMSPNDELGTVITAVNSMSEELKHREDELLQSKKLASLGVLTAGVAHEITNPLNNISMIAQTYAELYAKLKPEERVSLMNKVEVETGRIREIVRNLLDFSKPKEAVLEQADVNDVVSKSLSLVQNMLDVSNIDARLNLCEGLPPVLIDIPQIQQVLVNLVTNAVQAMNGGGKLVLSSRHGKGGDSVEIAVADTGKGIPPEFLPHVFDPFFSTKGEAGTGLGLSVSYGIIKHHKGDIRVESKPGTGTTFTLELPVLHKEER